MRNFLYAGFPIFALFIGAPGAAGEDRVTIVPQVQKDARIDLHVQRMHDFEASVRLNVRTDPALVPSARVIELVERIGMVDEAGIDIVRGYDIDIQNDIVVGWSGGTAEIIQTTKTPTGFDVAALFKDHQGRIVTPPQGSVGSYTTGGIRYCFDQETVEEAIHTPMPMSFVLLIDDSGSMKSVTGDVRRAARDFIDTLPNTAQCTVAAFSDDWTSERGKGFGTNTCRAKHFSMSGLKAHGGTDLYAPLEHYYRQLSRKGHQTAVVVITDGQLNGSLSKANAVRRAKGKTVTFAYFLGGQEKKHLRGIVDNYIIHSGDLNTQLHRYFQVISTAYKKQTVLRMKACPAASNSHARTAAP